VGSHKEDTTVVVVSYSGKEINAKLVYYGAGLCGKTTNLEAIYEAVPDTSRGKMVSMKTQSDRTLFFDLLPLDLGEIMGFKTRFLLYTVPGQVFYNATRKLVLKGADAIVFVADSEVGKMEENKESLANLKANLAEYKLSLDDIPWVLQYNKRDLPNIYTCDELNAEINPGGTIPYFEAVATQGRGVFETFRGISHLLMEKVTKDLRRGSSASTPMREAAKLEDPPARPAAASAPPMAPARAIEREAQVTGAQNGPEAGGGIEYGRQIELPDEIPPAAPARPATPGSRPAAAPAPAAPAPARPAATTPTPVAVPMPASIATPMPEPAMASAAAPAKLPLTTSDAPIPTASEIRARMAAAQAAQSQTQSAPAQPPPATEAVHTLKAAPTQAGEPSIITLPVQFPVGQGGEVVIRIVFKPAA
jgi:signal recognition particle receptor subunit beta